MTGRESATLIVVVADALVAAGDDTRLVFSRRAACRLAERLIDHLAVLGYQITAPPAHHQETHHDQQDQP